MMKIISTLIFLCLLAIVSNVAIAKVNPSPLGTNSPYPFGINDGCGGCPDGEICTNAVCSSSSGGSESGDYSVTNSTVTISDNEDNSIDDSSSSGAGSSGSGSSASSGSSSGSVIAPESSSSSSSGSDLINSSSSGGSSGSGSASSSGSSGSSSGSSGTSSSSGSGSSSGTGSSSSGGSSSVSGPCIAGQITFYGCTAFFPATVDAGTTTPGFTCWGDCHGSGSATFTCSSSSTASTDFSKCISPGPGDAYSGTCTGGTVTHGSCAADFIASFPSGTTQANVPCYGLNGGTCSGTATFSCPLGLNHAGTGTADFSNCVAGTVTGNCTAGTLTQGYCVAGFPATTPIGTSATVACHGQGGVSCQGMATFLCPPSGNGTADFSECSQGEGYSY